MSLPKEPRQKMINIMYLVLTALLALNVSSQILNAFIVVDKSLTTSNANISASNDGIYQSLKAQLKDSGTAQKARIWAAKADTVKMLSSEMTTYIDNLKQELLLESGLHNDEDGKPEYKKDDLEAATRLFGNGDGGRNRGPHLEDSLKAYRDKMLALDPDFKKQYENTFPVDMKPQVDENGKPKDFTTSFFTMTPTVAAVTILSKFQNNIKNAENLEATYCHDQVGAVKFILNKFEPIAVSSATYLMPGDKMTVSAGVGAFNDASKPDVTINGAHVDLNDKGVAEKDIVASGGGNQKVHVVINYTKPDGTRDQLTKDIDYTVGTPGGAAVMLDKMNVFYIGVDNPVTIGSPTGWDKTQVTISGGGATIDGSGSKRTVHVGSVGACTINVIANGKPTAYQFRIKRIPDPVFKVGPSAGGRVQAAIFKAQTYCRAELENFDFDAHFSVISATIYFTGAGFSVVQVANLDGNNIGSLPQLSMCRPGSSIIFDNVKVKGPDGTERTITGPGFILN
jgi:gliding motility-associated protein GldM